MVHGKSHLNSHWVFLSFCLAWRAGSSLARLRHAPDPKHTHKLVNGFSPHDICSCLHRNKLLRIPENKRQNSNHKLDNCLHCPVDGSDPTSGWKSTTDWGILHFLLTGHGRLKRKWSWVPEPSQYLCRYEGQQRRASCSSLHFDTRQQGYVENPRICCRLPL